MQLVKNLLTLPRRIQPVKHLLLRHQRPRRQEQGERFEQILEREIEKGRHNHDEQ